MRLKKYALNILILTVLVGFSPLVTVHAAGTCSNPDFITAAECGSNEYVWTPDSTTASTTFASDGIGGLLFRISEILNLVIPILLALGVVYFVWGVVRYVIGDADEAKKKGRDQIIYGIIGLTVIVSLWGLVNIVVNTFDLGGSYAPDVGNLVATSDTCSIGTKLQGLLDYATCLIGQSVIPLIFAGAVLMFIWGVVQFVINSDDESKKTKGKQFMIWGIIALAVMVSVWGLVRILGDTFGIEYAIPQVKSQ